MKLLIRYNSHTRYFAYYPLEPELREPSVSSVSDHLRRCCVHLGRTRSDLVKTDTEKFERNATLFREALPRCYFV